MALKGALKIQPEQLPAMPVLALAHFEQSGLTDLINSEFNNDKRKILTPGNTVKSVIEANFMPMRRVPIYLLDEFYGVAPVDLLFGSKVKHRCLNDRAYERNPDSLFGIDLPVLLNRCYSHLCERYGLDSSLFNIDSTNFTITSFDKEIDEDAAMPQRCGHAKDGHNDRLVYSLLSITDENGIVCYEKPYDGATADSEMDRHAVEFLATVSEPEATTLVADCKIVTGPLISLMEECGFGFVSKCPDSFGKKVRKRVIDSIESGSMQPSSIRDGWEIYDTDADVGGRNLRFVAFRTSDDVQNGIEYLRDQGGKDAEARFRRFASRKFNCEEDARREFDAVMSMHIGSAYDVKHTVFGVEVKERREGRGRPPKGWVPEFHTEYMVDVELEFNEQKALELSENRYIRVIVTNLPRTAEDGQNLRSGATADSVLKTYLGQYKVEHAFRLMKSGFGMSSVYVHRPLRENVMVFMYSMCTMISDVIHTVLRKNGMDLTAEHLVCEFMHLSLTHDRNNDSEKFTGEVMESSLFLECAKTLKIDVNHLFH